MRNALRVGIVQKKFVLISTWFDFNESDGFWADINQILDETQLEYNFLDHIFAFIYSKKTKKLYFPTYILVF